VLLLLFSFLLVWHDRVTNQPILIDPSRLTFDTLLRSARFTNINENTNTNTTNEPYSHTIPYLNHTRYNQYVRNTISIYLNQTLSNPSSTSISVSTSSSNRRSEQCSENPHTHENSSDEHIATCSIPTYIPYSLPSVALSSTVQQSRIPKIIWQTWKSHVMGKATLHAISTWIDMNEEYEYYFMDDTQVQQYVHHWLDAQHDHYDENEHQHYDNYASATANNTYFNGEYFRAPFLQCGHPINPLNHKYAHNDDDDGIDMYQPFSIDEIMRVREAYSQLSIGASRADLWRYLVLYEFGGIYSDIDSGVTRPCRFWVSPDADVVTGIGSRGDVNQWVMIYRARHPILAATIRLAVDNILSHDTLYINSRVEAIAGPRVLTEAAHQLFCSNQRHRARLLSAIELLPCDRYCDNVQVKLLDGEEERARMGVPHWGDEQEKHVPWYYKLMNVLGLQLAYAGWHVIRRSVM